MSPTTPRYTQPDSGYPTTPTAPAIQSSLTVPENADFDDSDSDTASDSEDDDDDDYDTADESLDSDEEEPEMSEEQRKAEREARALERQRVLEAAGLIIKSKTDNRRKPPARPIRARSFRKRRAPPAIPKASIQDTATHKELPAIPEPEPEQETSFRLDDAYERYEAYKKSNANMNRLSTVSLDTDISSLGSPQPPTPVPTSPALSTAENESLTHSILHFFGRSKTPAEGESKPRPVISGPISGPIPARGSTPPGGRPLSQSGDSADSGFGSVSRLAIFTAS